MTKTVQISNDVENSRFLKLLDKNQAKNFPGIKLYKPDILFEQQSGPYYCYHM